MSDQVSSKKQRVAELVPGANGTFRTEWNLTDASLTDVVRLTVPPRNVVPIVFVPGIMGSNLCDMDGMSVWLLNSISNVPAGLALDWSRKNAGRRQAILHPARTKVYRLGAVPNDSSRLGMARQDYLKRGWGEISEASYHQFLLWLDTKMNGERDPANWDDFSNASTDGLKPGGKAIYTLPPGLVMKMRDLPDIAEAGRAVDPITSDELLNRAKSIFPIYAFGYNWLDSNSKAAKLLKERIENIIGENNSGAMKCTQVILITHSMGGLVARACCQLPGISKKIVGIVHGVMPATGAAVAYRRCKVGMRDEDFAAGLVIGSSGDQVTAVFAQSPGALQLLPSMDYGTGWLKIHDPTGKVMTSLPVSDPYEEIYLQREKWWGLVREEWLRPTNGVPIRWNEYAMNIKQAREFHVGLSRKYHPNTYVFYGGGTDKQSFLNVNWRLRKGVYPSNGGLIPSAADIPRLSHKDLRTDGSNNLYVGGGSVARTSERGDVPFVHVTETSFWEIRCQGQDSAGDGTVPAGSGRSPRHRGGQSVLQQFELAGIQHEPAYRKYATARVVAYYAITKLAAIATLR